MPEDKLEQNKQTTAKNYVESMCACYVASVISYSV